ncbi:MAG: PQQ-dependent sugar dehydrogenase [Planctomycetota bacterium]|nr:PQQ-dependent sugar dehydrogenase [Planctomycetota bacterium]
MKATRFLIGKHILAAWLLLLPCMSGVFADESINQLTESEKRSGWELLFDGTSLEGFKGYQQDTPGAGWQVIDGAIVRTEAAGDLLTKEMYDSFEIQLEYRISKAGNSGLMFHVSEDGKRPWYSGPEVQIIDNDAGKDGQKAGWLYQLYEPHEKKWVMRIEKAAGLPVKELVDATRPAGEWNHLYLRVTPGSSEVCLNGVSYYKFVIGNDDWNKRVAKSKFSKFEQFGKAGNGHLCFQDHGDEVAFRSIKVRRLPDGKLPRKPADGTLSLEAVPAFPGLAWEGWSPLSDDGKPVPPLRPLMVTHANDGSGRRFIVEQSGLIYVIEKDGQKAKIFLDIRDITRPWKKANEEGLLGLAFHPRFSETGEFFVCYSPVNAPQSERISRFHVSAKDSRKADKNSEETVLQFDQPFPNHNGGSIAFGPDGFLYVGLGDGGSRNDPFDNAQNLGVLLGKILRIDIDRRGAETAYAIPLDNPFMNMDGVRPEIWAFGFRNPWQLTFDNQTGTLWMADVGQDLQEEINLVEKGGNYGWRRREGSYPFGNIPADLATIDPLWEYDHQVGKSITGGLVVRGSTIPELEGRYLYGDFVSGRLWALGVQDSYDPSTISNQLIPWNGLPIFGFGHDQDGAVYVLTSSNTGQGIYRIQQHKEKSASTGN